MIATSTFMTSGGWRADGPHASKPLSRQLRVIPVTVREDIQARSRLATSDRQVGRIIFDALRAANIHWQSVSLDEVKQTLVEALRARHAVSA